MSGPAEFLFERTSEHEAVVNYLRDKTSTQELMNYLHLDVLKQLFLFDRTKKVEALQQAKMSLLELIKDAKRAAEKLENQGIKY